MAAFDLTRAWVTLLVSALGTSACEAVTGLSSLEASGCEDGEIEPCTAKAPGSCTEGTRRCNLGVWEACSPGAPKTENCATTEDEDCDATETAETKLDDNCKCHPNEVQSCHSQADATLNVGLCHAGEQTCTEDGLGWTACQGEVLPKNEDCAPELLDEDCDGLINEEGPSCICVPGDAESCYTGAPGTEGVGQCTSGTRTCLPTGLEWSACQDDVTPGTETCDGKLVDEDCNGETNESGPLCECIPGSAAESCDSGAPGVCGPGTKACLATGLFAACISNIEPGSNNEICNNTLDDNCDGATDSADSACCAAATTRACFTGDDPATRNVGQCHDGLETCQSDNTWGTDCVGETAPSKELCNNGVDDDCDGRLDGQDAEDECCEPGSTRSCYEGPEGTENVGTCESGIETCQPSKTWGACTDQVWPAERDDCFTAADEDCDGFANHGCISASDTLTCAVDTDTANANDAGVYCWGTWGGGSAKSATLIAKGATQVSASAGSACYLDSSGKVGCVGLSKPTALPAGAIDGFAINTATPTDSTPVGLGCVQSTSGALNFWKLLDASAAPTMLAGPFKFIGMGGLHQCALDLQGHAFCWGTNGKGQLGTGDDLPLSGPTFQIPGRVFSTIAAGGRATSTGSHTCGISGGQLYCWGFNTNGQDGMPSGNFHLSPNLVNTETDWTELALGNTHSCGLRGDQAWCWGDNHKAQIVGSGSASPTPFTSLGNYVRIAAGQLHTCGTKPGTRPTVVTCRGDNSDGQAPATVTLP